MKFADSLGYYLLAGFVSGFSTMLLELTAVRVLAPYFGTSIIVWTNVIAVVLVSLSAGAFFSGRLYKKNSGRNLFPKILFYAGLSIVCVPFFSSIFLPITFHFLYKNIISLFVFGSFVSMIFLFGLPFFILGIVSPYLISIFNEKFPEKNVGYLISISTLGSLLGTVLPTVLLISYIGSKLTIFLAGFTLIALGFFANRNKNYIFFIIFILFATNFNPPQQPNLIVQKETKEQYVKVVEAEGVRYLSFDSGLGVQSEYDPNSILTGEYFDYINIFPALIQKKEESLRVLILGLAGGTTVRELKYYFGENIEIDAVEIDPEVTTLAKEYMGLDPNFFVHNLDARVFLSSLKSTYDVIYVDAFSKEFQVPWHLTTLEFWKLVSKNLNENGVVGMNVIAIGSDKENLFVDSLISTGKKVFEHVYIMPVTTGNNSNKLILMSKNSLEVGNLTKKNINKDLISIYSYASKNIKESILNKNAFVLSDDSAPVELLTIMDAFK